MTKITVKDGELAVLRVDGRVERVLASGRHQLPRSNELRLNGFRRREVRVQPVDVRRRLLLVAGQELAASDVPGVRVTAVVTWAVTDPVKFLDVAADPVDSLRVAAQVALRDAVARRTLADLTADRAELERELTAAVEAASGEVGVEVRQVVLRDVSPPGEVRRAQLALVTAREEGLAALERARAETAALRALANGARVLAEHPGLLQLRTAQVVSRAGGTVVLRTDAATAGTAPDGVPAA